ncbi:hypothetical protein MHBO_004222 [Bonamia ostreae]|uniref:Protein kinase domain-containing protein n=2 Tax=Bonamia ostreae TaxID=126728 RepID=A0ABV2ASQ2_9EUKA
MFDRKGCLKMIGFGLCYDKLNSRELSNIRGTQEFTAPEILDRGNFEKVSDVFSTGACILVLWNKNYKNLHDNILTFLQTNNRPGFKQLIDISNKEIVDLVWNLMKYNPRYRMTMEKLKVHQYVVKYAN